MSNPLNNEQQCLAWIEGQLDQDACRLFEEQLEHDPDLASRLHAMRRDRELLCSMPVPPVPSDLSERVERVMARPMLTEDQPHSLGRFRLRTRQAASHGHWRVHFRMAAMIVICMGLVAVLYFITPVNRVLSSLNDENMSTNGEGVQGFVTTIAPIDAPVQAGDELSLAGRGEVEVAPEPLAMVLRSDSDVLPRLKLLVDSVNGVLIRNASKADLMQDGLAASISGTEPSESRPSPPSPSSVLTGDIALSPSYDDQFRYAGAGSIYTVSVPLSRLDELLAVLDDSFGGESVVLLLEDHLSQTQHDDWVQTLRAREAVSTWTADRNDPIVILPVFLP